MNCPNCGAENNPAATFCGLCHTAFGESQQPRKYPELPLEQPSKSQEPRSDAYYRPPGSYETTTKRGSLSPRKALVLGVTVSVLFILSLVLMLVVHFVYIRPLLNFTYVTYKSSKSALTFKHPKDWEQVDLATLESHFGNSPAMGGLSPSMASQYFDTAFMGPNKTKPRWLIVAIKVDTNLASKWETSKDKEIWLRQATLAMQSQATSQGITLSSVKTGDIKVGNDDGATIEYNVTRDGTSGKLQVAAVVISYNEAAYQVTLMAVSPIQTAFHNCWGNIKKSMGFYR